MRMAGFPLCLLVVLVRCAPGSGGRQEPRTGHRARRGERTRRQLARNRGGQGRKHRPRGRDEPDRLGVGGGSDRARVPARLQGGRGRVCGRHRGGTAGYPERSNAASRHRRLAVRRAVTEIRSFRRVFDLERRIYTIDKLRLNPAGVPVRGVAYALALLAATLLVSRAPVIGSVLRVLSWYLRELAFPAGAATVLATIRVDGRTFHLAARAHLRLLTSPRSVSGLRRPSAARLRSWPPDLLLLPDGSDGRFRALRYHGPGAVLVRAPHERAGGVQGG